MPGCLASPLVTTTLKTLAMNAKLKLAALIAVSACDPDRWFSARASSRASASGVDHAAFRPPGDELVGVAVQLSRVV